MAPLFVKEGIPAPAPIESMPGQQQQTLDSIVKEVRELAERGVAGVVLFGVPERKDERGTEAYRDDAVLQTGLRLVKDELGDDFVVVADLCLCEYTSHGHCGLLDGRRRVDNDLTLETYARIAVSQARAGADVVAPSGMMDGQVGAIRNALDSAGFPETAILAYAAKYASSFYGPFREAAEGAPRFGDRRSYQQDPANFDEAMREVGLDIAEGADHVMVKPGLAYLDIIRRVHERFEVPFFAYQVSGEYAMIEAAARNGWLDGERAMMESLIAFKRAGADGILTYYAPLVAEKLREG